MHVSLAAPGTTFASIRGLKAPPPQTSPRHQAAGGGGGRGGGGGGGGSGGGGGGVGDASASAAAADPWSLANLITDCILPLNSSFVNCCRSRNDDLPNRERDRLGPNRSKVKEVEAEPVLHYDRSANRSAPNSPVRGVRGSGGGGGGSGASPTQTLVWGGQAAGGSSSSPWPMGGSPATPRAGGAGAAGAAAESIRPPITPYVTATPRGGGDLAADPFKV